MIVETLEYSDFEYSDFDNGLDPVGAVRWGASLRKNQAARVLSFHLSSTRRCEGFEPWLM